MFQLTNQLQGVQAKLWNRNIELEKALGELIPTRTKVRLLENRIKQSNDGLMVPEALLRRKFKMA